VSPFTPLIGITCGSDSRQPKSPLLYESSLAKAGGSTLFVSPECDVIETASHCSGIIIPGGRDIAPLRYGEKQTCEINPEEEKRTEFEVALLNEIIKMRKPVLGICYGMQLLNTYFGGTLYQDIRSGIQNPAEHGAGMHGITVRKNPFLNEGSFEVNSSHHQAVKGIGRDLVAFAFAPDGVMEGFYGARYPFLIGVQWHPERLAHELSIKLFSVFIKACNARE
jgi:putative glutamine amidotransferase